MALAEVLSKARALPRAEQLQLVEELTTELRESADPASLFGLVPGREYAVWSPLADGKAVSAALRALEESRLES